ncbi:MAG: DUF3052 family protein [Sphingomonas sp.]|nr:DUF3052 family protein [Sphingomonas sp.]
MTTGYSGTPLARKLSLKDGLRVWWEDMPSSVRAEIEEHGYELVHLVWPEPPIEAGHIFVSWRSDLETALARLRPLLASDGFLWVSWPKQAAKRPGDVTEDAIRELALPLGLIDVKVCAVDDIWSGLKLMIRKELRGN